MFYELLQCIYVHFVIGADDDDADEFL